MTQLGKYQLHEELGRGGYGTVYRATDTALEVPRAVKVLHPALVADPIFIERFRREARFAARLKHPHIVPVYDLGQAEGRFFLAMDYLHGGSLNGLLKREGRLSFERALEILGQIAAALDHIHQQGLIHRDVKPGNILFDENGSACLSDLGFAKALSGAGSASLSASGGVIGTPAYMAPEIWLGQEPGPQTDVYSLACVFYEMLTGESLFGGGENTPPPLVMKRHFDPLELPAQWPEGVPDGIKGVLEKALAKEPADRFASAGEFVKASEDIKRKAENAAGVGDPLPGDHRPQRHTPVAPSPDHLTPDTAARGTPLRQHWGVRAGLAALALMLGVAAVALVLVVWLAGLGGGTPLTFLATETPAPTPMSTPTPTSTPMPTPTPTLTPTLISEWLRPADGMVMVYIPAGEFKMGSPSGDPDAAYDEFPQHKVYLDAFWIDQTEVTNAMYQNCVAAGVCEPPTDRTYFNNADYAKHPVVYVSWYDASAYCQWAGSSSGAGQERLPTEAEWEKAARGGQEGKRYPWGDEFDCRQGNFDDEQEVDNYVVPGGPNCDGYLKTAPVGSYAPNGYGLYDMAGNVWEWVADWYGRGYYQNSPVENPSGPASGDYRVLRGGSWDYFEGNLRVAARYWDFPDGSRSYDGFRCARSAASP